MATMTGEVVWDAEWECAGCGDTGGPDVVDDGVSPDSGHDCDEGGDVEWCGEWECHACGAGGQKTFFDGSSADSGHECADEEG